MILLLAQTSSADAAGNLLIGGAGTASMAAIAFWLIKYAINAFGDSLRAQREDFLRTLTEQRQDFRAELEEFRKDGRK